MTNRRKIGGVSDACDAALPACRLSRDFLAFFNACRSSGRPVALIAVTRTEGSSYSKAGQLVLIDLEGRFAGGLISGGCLENDLAQRAAEAMQRKQSASVAYDLRDDDAVFGLGVGCDGAIHLRIEPLHPGNDYEPLASSIAHLHGAACSALTLAGDDGDQDTAARMRLFRPASILVLGAGPDAPPLLQMIDALGWNGTAIDHRQHYLDTLRQPTSTRVQCMEAAAVSNRLDLAQFDAAIVMSHNLATDQAYLEALARSDLGFVGLLGPPHRRERLLRELGEATARRLDGRLRAPVGRRIGGRGPAAIALEIAAELQAYVCSLESP